MVTISAARRENQWLADGKIAVVTIHQSYLLRLRDAADKEREYRAFVADLRRGNRLCA
jgi:uracil-DNA glycosylase